MADQAADYRSEMGACAEAIGLNHPAIVQPQDHWADLNGIRLHYLDWGNPTLPHLILLHGGGLTAHTWDMAALLLRDTYHLVALDLRGHGDSGWTPEDQADDLWALLVEDTRAFIQHIGYDHVTLCGMSMGGVTVARYAGQYPEGLDALIVVDVAPTIETQGQVDMQALRRDTETMNAFDDFLNRAIKFAPHRHPAHLRYSLMHSLKQVPEGWTWKQQTRSEPEGLSDEERKARMTIWSGPMQDAIGRVRAPSLLIRGANSKILSEQGAQAMVAEMRDCEFRLIEGATHNVQGDQPAVFAREVDAFLQRRGIR